MEQSENNPAAASARIPRCFDRTARLLGPLGMARLAEAHVMVFGLGGVGSYAAEALARSGVGKITLVDFDDVCITNVNRQLHALPSTVGRAKSDLMAERLLLINPRGDFQAVRKFYEAAVSDEFLLQHPDFIIDCIDNITAKIHMIKTCLEMNLPIVSSMGASGKLDPTAVRVTNLEQTHTDPLARAVRKTLKDNYRLPRTEMARVLAVFSAEPVILPNPEYKTSLCGVECFCPNQDNDHHTCEQRSIIHGSAVFVTAAFGLAAASVVVRQISGADARNCAKPTDNDK